MKFGVLMMLTVFSYSFICIIMGGKLRLHCMGTLTSWSFPSTTIGPLRGDFHTLRPPRNADTLPSLDIHRSVRHNVNSIHRILWAQQRRQSSVLTVSEAQRISSHLWSFRRLGRVSTGLGSLLADLSDSQHHRSHHWADVGLLLLLLRVDG